MRRRRKGFTVSAEDARKALQMLVAEGKVAAQDIARALERRQKLIAQIRQRLSDLGGEGSAMLSRAVKKGRPVVARAAKRAAKAGRQGARRAARAGRRGAKRAISAATRAKYQAQGRYMAAVRTLPKTIRAKVREVREKSGVDAAIKAAKAFDAKKVMRHARERLPKD